MPTYVDLLLTHELVAPDDTLPTYTSSGGSELHLNHHCVPAALRVTGAIRFDDLSLVPAERRCACVENGHTYRDIVGEDVLNVLDSLRYAIPDRQAPTATVARLRWEALRLSRNKVPALAVIAAEAARASLARATEVTGTVAYRHQAAFRVLASIADAWRYERGKLQRNHTLSDLAPAQGELLVESLQRMTSAVSTELHQIVSSSGTGVQSLEDTHLRELSAAWEVAIQDTVWVRLNADVSPSNRNLLLGVTVEFDPDEPRLLRVPAAAWWTDLAERCHVVALGSWALADVATAVRLCGPDLSGVEDTLHALQMARA